MLRSKNSVVMNAIRSYANAINGKFKVGDTVTEGGRKTKVTRVLELPRDERIFAREFGGDWEDVKDDYKRFKTWYNIQADGNGVFYADIDLKKA